MSEAEDSSRPRLPLKLNWPTVFSYLAALVAASTVVLHLMGAVKHQHYLHHWIISSSLFLKSTDWILINGFYGIFDRSLAALVTIVGNLHLWVLATFLLGIYIFILRWPIGKASDRPPAWFVRQPQWRRYLIRYMLLTALFMGIFPLVLALLTVFISVPAGLGEFAGKATAEKHAKEFRKGCELSRFSCVALKRGDDVVTTGFVIDTSPTHVAIVDAQTLRGRVFHWRISSSLPFEGQSQTMALRPLSALDRGDHA